MEAFPNALKKGHWEVAALSLVIGMLRVAAKLPRDAVLNPVPAAGPSNAPARISGVQRG